MAWYGQATISEHILIDWFDLNNVIWCHSALMCWYRCVCISYIINQLYFRWWLGNTWHQAHTWTNDNHDHWHSLTLATFNLSGWESEFLVLSTLFSKVINSLWPNDAIWRYRSRSTLAHVMACCLTAPSHYLNQCWLILSKNQWHSAEGNLIKNSSPFNH